MQTLTVYVVESGWLAAKTPAETLGIRLELGDNLTGYRSGPALLPVTAWGPRKRRGPGVVYYGLRSEVPRGIDAPVLVTDELITPELAAEAVAQLFAPQRRLPFSSRPAPPAIQTLSPRIREAVDRVTVRGQTVARAAKDMGLLPKTVWAYLTKAKHALGVADLPRE